MPAVFYAGAVLNGNIGDPFPFDPWYRVFPALLPAFLIGPVEELGWRGVALPLLQRRLAPLWAALLLGVVSISVILTAMFNAARGSLLVACLFHAQMNGPAWPDAQPWDMYLFAVVAVLVVLLNRTAMHDGRGAVTDVLPAEDPHTAQAVPEPATEMKELR
jgi:membrane protease YdiL (CAAX protease family)